MRKYSNIIIFIVVIIIPPPPPPPPPTAFPPHSRYFHPHCSHDYNLFAFSWHVSSALSSYVIGYLSNKLLPLSLVFLELFLIKDYYSESFLSHPVFRILISHSNHHIVYINLIFVLSYLLPSYPQPPSPFISPLHIPKSSQSRLQHHVSEPSYYTHS